MNEAIQSLLEHIGIDPFNHHHSDSQGVRIRGNGELDSRKAQV